MNVIQEFPSPRFVSPQTGLDIVCEDTNNGLHLMF